MNQDDRYLQTAKQGIQGLFVVQNSGGASTPPSLSAIWKQDGLDYRATLRGGFDRIHNVVSQRDKSAMINLAISMAKESLIQSACKIMKTGRKKFMKNKSLVSLVATLTILGLGALTKPESVARANQSLVYDTALANSDVVNGRSQTIAQQPKPQLITWKQFVEQGGGRYIQVDYDLPNEFRNGYVYFNQGASVITAYILKQGLSNYPPVNVGGLGEIDADLGDRYVRSGKAIVFLWNLGNSGLRFANDTQVRFTQKETGCFRTNCLTAPFMTNEQIIRILRSKKRIEQKN